MSSIPNIPKVDADQKDTDEGDWKDFSLGVIYNF